MTARRLPFLLAACLAAALLTPPASAQGGFTNADLEGRHAFLLTSDGSGDTGRTRYGGGLLAIGSLEFDGLGTVTGHRTLRRRLVFHDGAWNVTYEELDQELTGTYSVGADGRAVLEITAEPNPPWMPYTGSSAWPIDLGAQPESWRLSIADGACRLELLAELRGRELGDRYQPEVHVQLAGTAERHGPGCRAAEPDPRLDELLGEVADLRAEVGDLRELAARQSAQLCEILRLLHVPQGRRESDAPAVLEACGTGFDWNGER